MLDKALALEEQTNSSRLSPLVQLASTSPQVWAASLTSILLNAVLMVLFTAYMGQLADAQAQISLLRAEVAVN